MGNKSTKRIQSRQRICDSSSQVERARDWIGRSGETGRVKIGQSFSGWGLVIFSRVNGKYFGAKHDKDGREGCKYNAD